MSNEDDNDDLEKRKGNLWSMEEVRSGQNTATTEPRDAPVDEGGVDVSEPEAQSDLEETSDTDRADSATVTAETKDASETSDTKDTPTADAEPVQQAEGRTIRQMALDAEAKGLTVRDLHNVNVYLFESVYHDMRTKFKELDAEYYGVHGDDLSKNKDFFNAIFRAGLQSPQLEEELEIER